MLTTIAVIVTVVGSACAVAFALWHSVRPERSVTQILSELDSSPRR